MVSTSRNMIDKLEPSTEGEIHREYNKDDFESLGNTTSKDTSESQSDLASSQGNEKSRQGNSSSNKSESF